jgi:hypothetical protein
MKRLGICTLAVMLAACGGPTTASGGRPTASPTPTQSLSPSGTTASAGGLACRLPVITWTQTAQGQEPTEGFMTYPGGQFTSDASGAVVLDGTRYRTTAQPYLYGGGPGAGWYDWPMGRWLPARRQSVSPDGLHYADGNGFGAIHVVDVATGTDRTFKAPDGPDTVLYYAKEGVYFNHAYEGPPGPGLWLLDPTSGAVQTVFSDKSVDAVGGFAAWLLDVNPADPHPVFSQYIGGNMPNEVLRRDLNGGPTVRWFYQPGKSVTVTGFDYEKHPLIVAETLRSPDTVQVWQVPAANQGHLLYSGTQLAYTVADDHGIWFSDDQGISLYTPAHGLQKVSSLVAGLAGPCR